MTIFTNTFYKRDDFIPFLAQAEDALKNYSHDDDFEIIAISFTISDLLYAKSKYITQSDAQYVVEQLERLSEILDDSHYNHDSKALSACLDNGIVVQTEVEEATEKHHELMKELSRYHNLVEASHTVAQHGKSWEPAVSITNLGDCEYRVSFCSYQAGDQGEDPIEGSLEKLIKAVQSRVNNVQSRLLTGRTNTNPLVVMLLEDNTESTTQVFENLEAERPYAYKDVFFSNGVFLPDTTKKTISFSGYVYDDSCAHIETGESYYPDANAIGIDSLQ